MTAADDTRAQRRELAPLPPMPSLLTVVRARARVEELTFVRDRMALFFTFFFPLVLLLIFGSVFNKTLSSGVTFAQYFVAGMIASGLVGTGFQNLAISIPIEREDGTLKRLSGTPLPKAAYFAGKVVLILQSLIAQVVLLLLIGMLLFGVKLPTSGTKWFTFGWLLVLGTITCTLLGLAFSSVPKNGRGAPAIVSPVVIVLQFISGVFFVFSDLPKWMQTLSAVFPLKWLCQGMRSVFLPDSAAATEPAGSWELGRVALVLGIWAVIGAIACATTFRWQRRGDR
jgi:ABC-2 type transport system permease protein